MKPKLKTAYNGIDEEYDFHADQQKLKNKQTIMDMWEFIQRKGYKKSALYPRILELHKTNKVKLTVGDLVLIADLMGYKTLWATFKAQELGLIEDA